VDGVAVEEPPPGFDQVVEVGAGVVEVPGWAAPVGVRSADAEVGAVVDDVFAGRNRPLAPGVDVGIGLPDPVEGPRRCG